MTYKRYRRLDSLEVPITANFGTSIPRRFKPTVSNKFFVENGYWKPHWEPFEHYRSWVGTCGELRRRKKPSEVEPEGRPGLCNKLHLAILRTLFVGSYFPTTFEVLLSHSVSAIRGLFYYYITIM